MNTLPQQFATNYNVSRYDQMPWQTTQQVNRQQNEYYSQPILYWQDKFATSPASLIDFYRYISDSMCLGPHPLYGQHNPNRPDLFQTVRGTLKRNDYDALMRLFGDEPAIGVKDSHFFHNAQETIRGQVLRQPFQWTAKNINTAFAQEKIVDDSRKGAKMAGQALIQQLMAGGEGGLQGLVKPEVKLPRTSDDWLKYATGQEQIEGVITKLLHHIDYTSSFQDIAKQVIGDKFTIGAEFGHIDVANGHVQARRVHPAMVRWLAGKPVTTLEDPAVMAVQVWDYMTPQELVNTYGVGRLATGTGVKGALRYVEKLLDKNAPRIGYDPSASYWSTRGVAAESSNYVLDQDRQYTSAQVNWMRNVFYPTRGGQNALLVNILVQRNYFQMLSEKRFYCEKVERGVRSPATDRELKNWQTNRGGTSYDIDFTPVGGETVSARSNIKVYSRPELHQFTRVGHDGFIDCGPYRYAPDFENDTHERPRTGWPVKGQISYEKSMARLGEDDAVRVNFLMQKVDMFMAGLGYEDALIIDDAQGKDPISYRYNAKNTGLIKIDSTKYQPNNLAALKHIQTVHIGNETEQIQTLFAMIRQIRTEYELRVGAGPDVQGMTSQYASNKAQQQNIVGQQLLNIDFNYEHNSFMSQMLQGSADVAKVHYAVDKEVALLLGKGEVEILRLTTDLLAADFAIYLESGQVLADKKKALDQLSQMLMQSGGSEYAEALMSIALSDNPAEGLAKFRQIKSEIDNRAAQAAQSGQETAKIQAQQQREQRDHELLKLQMTLAAQLEMKRMEVSKNTDNNEFKGVMADIEQATSREDMILQAQMNNEQQALAAQQAAEQPTT